jgi:hypothetical protein
MICISPKICFIKRYIRKGVYHKRIFGEILYWEISSVAMPSADFPDSNAPASEGNDVARTRVLGPMQNSGLLESYDYIDITPVIGREFSGLQVTELLKGDEQLIRDLAITGKNPTYDYPKIYL